MLFAAALTLSALIANPPAPAGGPRDCRRAGGSRGDHPGVAERARRIPGVGPSRGPRPRYARRAARGVVRRHAARGDGSAARRARRRLAPEGAARRDHSAGARRDDFPAGAAQSLALEYRRDFMAFSGVQTPEARIEDAEIVFVGYGIVAPEYQWDDYKDVDVRGKVLLMMNNDPEDDPKLFAGKTRLWYGRWDYKYLMAGQKGAAGAILIHTTPSAGYPWQVVQTSWAGENFELPDNGEPRVQIKAWATEDASRRIAALGGKDLDRLRAGAQRRDFRPVPLGVRLSFALENAITRKEWGNVDRKASRLRSEPERAGRPLHGAPRPLRHQARRRARCRRDLQRGGRQCLGRGRPALRGEGVLAATEGSAALDLLRGRHGGGAGPSGVRVPGPKSSGPARTDRGQHQHRWDQHLWPNPRSDDDRTGQVEPRFDGRGPRGGAGPRRQAGSVPRPRLLLPLGPVQPRQGRRAGGVLLRGNRLRRPAGRLGTRADREVGRTHYHQPSDEYDPNWDLSGAVEDVRLDFFLGVRVADADAMPSWNPGDEFEAARKKALAEVAPR